MAFGKKLKMRSLKIAWIGTGVMGAPMAKHLMNQGHQLSVYNRTLSKAMALAPDATIYDDLTACVKDKDVVFTMVGYPKDVKEVYDVIIEHVSSDTVLVDMTTSSPTLAKEIYNKARKKGISVLDAPVTGGDLGAINRTLSIMVGGEEHVYQQILPLLKILGHKVNYMGEAGSGQHMKLANQTVIASNIIGIAEAITYAKTKKLNLNQVLDVINGGSAKSWQAEVNGLKMVNQDYKPGFFLKHFLKDLKLVLEEKEDLSLPSLEQVVRVYELLSNEGFDDQGTQVIIEAYIRKLI
jgi:3-hydroxyisobutyrate dehydrogenase